MRASTARVTCPLLLQFCSSVPRMAAKKGVAHVCHRVGLATAGGYSKSNTPTVFCRAQLALTSYLTQTQGLEPKGFVLANIVD